MLKSIFLAILAIAYASLVHNFEKGIMDILGNWKGANYFYFFIILLLPTIVLTGMSIKAYQASVA